MSEKRISLDFEDVVLLKSLIEYTIDSIDHDSSYTDKLTSTWHKLDRASFNAVKNQK